MSRSTPIRQFVNSSTRQLRQLRQLRQRRAFTLVELLLVLVIIAVLAAAAVTNFASRARDARVTRAKQDISTIETSIDAFKLDTDRYPEDNEGIAILLADAGNPEGSKGHYMKKMPMDPWNHPYNYKCPGTHGTDYDLWSSGPDGRDGTDDDITNWTVGK
jgi:general secretion pathway protein G